MNDKPIKTSTEAFEKRLQDAPGDESYVLRLFVSGMTPSSIKAIQRIKDICRKHLEGRYELEVIDIYQQPELGRREQITAVPILLKKLPLPLRKFIGDFSDTEKILVGLNLLPKKTEDDEK